MRQALAQWRLVACRSL